MDFALLGSTLFKVILSFLLVLPSALDRELSVHRMGLRTFPLVSVASCGYVLVVLPLIAENPDALARIVQGLMTGMGFIGGGAILKTDGHVRGTATAASLWLTGIIGASVAFDRYEIAVVMSLVNFLTLRVLTDVESRFLGGSENPPPDRPRPD